MTDITDENDVDKTKFLIQIGHYLQINFTLDMCDEESADELAYLLTSLHQAEEIGGLTIMQILSMGMEKQTQDFIVMEKFADIAHRLRSEGLS